jgi:formyltetrahydrofolate deformylase
LKNTVILLVQCPDRKGLDAAIADFIYCHGGNILHFEQHQAGEGSRLYLARVEWSLDGFQIEAGWRKEANAEAQRALRRNGLSLRLRAGPG